jgi:hypothetical protein
MAITASPMAVFKTEADKYLANRYKLNGLFNKTSCGCEEFQQHASMSSKP